MQDPASFNLDAVKKKIEAMIREKHGQSLPRYPLRQQALYFFPLPQGQGSLRPILLPGRTIVSPLPEAARS